MVCKWGKVFLEQATGLTTVLMVVAGLLSWIARGSKVAVNRFFSKYFSFLPSVSFHHAPYPFSIDST